LIYIQYCDKTNRLLVALGTRDLGVLKTLFSIVFGWGLTPLLVALYSSQSAASSASTSTPLDAMDLLRNLKILIVRIASLLWPSPTYPGTSAQPTRLFPSHITKILITAHITDILRAGISVGWISQPDEEVHRIVVELLKMLVIPSLLRSFRIM
jgi:hypothetical protein